MTATMIKTLSKFGISKDGLTLVETVVYMAVLAALTAALVGSVASLFKSYRLAKTKTELVTSTQTVWASFFKEVKNAREVYSPTTVLDSDTGELSLVSAFQPTDKTEPETYVDMYLAGGRVWLKRENETPQALTSNVMEVTSFRIEKFSPGAKPPGLRLHLTVRARERPDENLSLTAFAVLRGGYAK